MTALTIARVNLLRLARDRSGWFFIFLLPIMLVMVLGIMYGGRSAPRLGVVDADGGPLAAELIDGLATGAARLELHRYATEEALQDAVERGGVEVGAIVPAGYEDALRTGNGVATVVVLNQPEAGLAPLRLAVEATVAAQSARVRAARLAAAETGVTLDGGLATAAALEPQIGGIRVAVESVGQEVYPATLGTFSIGAQSQLVLFIFITSLTGATQLILSRRLGVSRRMVATPTPVRTIILGETLGRFGIAMVQGLFIIAVTIAAFGVDWGDPLAAGLLVVTFAFVATGAAMVLGVFASNPDQAGAMGLMLGMALGAFGGAMVPPEIFPETMKTISLVTPHAWAIDGFRTLIFRGGGLAEILPHLAVLWAMAGGLMAIGAWGLRRALTRG